MDPVFYRCPVCRKKLEADSKALVCENGHSFDRARQGYVNLLISSSADHGDNAGMVGARTRFLDAGYYAPLADALAETIPKDARSILDAGCGEGYYTQRIFESDRLRSVFGTDVSKHAVKSACRRTKDVSWSVSTVNDLPFFDGAFDALICVFAPLAKSEYARVLKPGGQFTLAIPLKDHLIELKNAVYDTPYPNRPFDPALEGFVYVGKKEISYGISLESNQAVKDLFSMTPYSFNTSPDDAKKLDGIESLKTKVSFALLEYQRN